MKKTLSIILIITMLLGMLTAFTFASTTPVYVELPGGNLHLYSDYYANMSLGEGLHNGSLAIAGQLDLYFEVRDPGTYNLDFHSFKANTTMNYDLVDVEESYTTVYVKFYGVNEFITPMTALNVAENSKVIIELADNSSVKFSSTTDGHDVIIGTVEMKDGSALPAPDENGDIIITKGTPVECTHTYEYLSDTECALKCGGIVAGSVEHDYSYELATDGHTKSCVNCNNAWDTPEEHTLYYYHGEDGGCYYYCDYCDYTGKAASHLFTEFAYYDKDHCINYCYNCGYGDEQTGLVEHDFIKSDFPATEIEAAHTWVYCSICGGKNIEYNRENVIYFELESYNNSDWNDTVILALKNGVPLTLIRNYDGDPIENYAIPYDKDASYSFVFIDDSGCAEEYGVKIYFPDSEEPVFASSDLSEYYNLDVLYSHNIANYDKLFEALDKVPAYFESYTKESVDALKAAVEKIRYYLPASKQAEVDAIASEIETAVTGLTPASEPYAHGLINLTDDVEILENGGKKGYYYANADKFYEYDSEYTVFDCGYGEHTLKVSTKADITALSLWLHNENGTFTVAEGGDVNLTALGDNWFLAELDSSLAGLNVNKGGKLTITDKTDSIIALGDNDSAGIGSGYSCDAGDITINGGVIFALSMSDGAGIGTGNNGAFGTITINGGRVHAECLNDDGAGIGTGDSGNGGDIIINGGDITALSLDDDGAGIGGGDEGHTDSITINGGNILAGTDDAACIGGGSSNKSYGGKITINGGILREHHDSGTNYFIGNDSLNEKGEDETNFVEINGGNILSNGAIVPEPKNKDGQKLFINSITVGDALADKTVPVIPTYSDAFEVIAYGNEVQVYLPESDHITNQKHLENGVIVEDTTKIFKDVKKGKWYVDAIDHCYSYGFIAGVEKDTFGVDTPVTRGMFITILARIAGVDTGKEANKVQTKFSDVKSGKYYTAAIKWASENGVVAGITKTEFKPDSPLERQQLCVMIVNFAKYMNVQINAYEEKITFADEKAIGDYAKKAVEICQKADIINGIANGKSYLAKPKDTATRAQAAQMLYTFHADAILNLGLHEESPAF